MAIIKCNECGKEISERAVVCPHCGIQINVSYGNEENINNKNNYKKILLPVVCIFTIIGIIAIVIMLKENKEKRIAKEKEEKYYTAIEKIESFEIDEAKQIFLELGDYKDSAMYVDKLTSRVEGVTDTQYYKTIHFVDKISSSSYKNQLMNNIQASMENAYPDGWSEIPYGDIIDMLKKEDYIIEEIEFLDNIYLDDMTDEQIEYEKALVSYYQIILDNAWAEAMEDDVFSGSIQLKLKFSGYSNDEIDELKPIWYEGLKEMYIDVTEFNVENFDYINFIGMFSFISLEDELGIDYYN